MGSKKRNSKLIKNKFIDSWHKKLDETLSKKELFEASKIIDNFYLEKIKNENHLEIKGFGNFFIIRNFFNGKFKNYIKFNPDNNFIKNLKKFYFIFNNKTINKFTLKK